MPTATRAVALEAGDHVDALSAVQAGAAQALVHLRLAVEARVAGRALAPVLVDAVDALAVEARVGVALVDVVLAVGAPGALGAAALVPVGQVLAGAAVLARLLVALVDLAVAEEARVAGPAVAVEGVAAVHAGPVPARVVLAVVAVDLAPLACKD